nr:hypothetical protein [Tanacetum cinerariifolium]
MGTTRGPRLDDNEIWNDLRDFAKLVKAISMPYDFLSTSDRRLIELKNQVQCIMEAYLTQAKPVQMNKIASSLVDETKSYPVGIVRNVEVHVGKLKLFEDFHVVDMEREPTWPLLVGSEFLATANAVINCKKAKIVVGEGLTRLIFMVKELDFGDDNEPYWTTIGKRESYKLRTSEDGIGAQPPYYAKRDFWNNHLPGEWKIAKDPRVNPFKDVLVFRKMVEFLGAIPINLKENMWE